ncbi:MAG: NUDIX domain-containing protein [Clostridia bacterium]|nr:NUDIX domain-containing protein [Clostridia bacterium]
MPEYRDVHTREGVPTGEVREKHAPSRPGDYFLHTIDILRCRDGRYILQQRSLKSRYYPGVWDVTGGGVDSGETPIQAGIREAQEELGLLIRPEDMRDIYRYYADWDDGSGLILYVYGCSVDLPEGGLTPAEKEVNAVRLASFQEYFDAVTWNKDAGFKKALQEFEESFRSDR